LERFEIAMELIWLAQHGRPLTREEHEVASVEGIPIPSMEGMAEITAGILERPAAEKSSYKPESDLALCRLDVASRVGQSGTKTVKEWNKSLRLKSNRGVTAEVCTSVTDGLSRLYFEKV